MLFAMIGATFLLVHFALFNSASEHSNSLSREDRASEQSRDVTMVRRDEQEIDGLVDVNGEATQDNCLHNLVDRDADSSPKLDLLPPAGRGGRTTTVAGGPLATSPSRMTQAPACTGFRAPCQSL